jgi:putative PEP-CTERM system TPR-repeat lipoprotein
MTMALPFPPFGRVGASILLAAALLAACGGKSDADMTASAKQLLEQKDLQGAMIQLKNALQKQPNSAEARLLLGKTLLELGDPVSALVELGKAQELQSAEDEVVPPIARAMVLVGDDAKLLAQYGNTRLKSPAAAADLGTSLAVAYAVRGEKDKAWAALNQALRAAPTYARANVMEARLKAAEGDMDGALKLLDEVLTREPTNDGAGVLKGEVLLLGKQDTAGALATFRKVLAANPKSVSAHVSVISILNSEKKPEEARAQYEALKKVQPNHPETLFYQAQFAYQDKDFKTTKEVADRLLKAMPESPRALELAGAASFRLKRYPEAEASLGKALKVAPGLLLARQLLAQTYLRTGQPQKTIELLQPLAEAKNPDATALSLIGEAWLQLGDAKKSDAAYAQAEKAAPNDPRVRTALAMSQILRGNSAGAATQLEAIAAEDKSPRADVALISARLRQNDLPGALKAIDGLEKKLPDKALAHNLRGRVLLLKRDIPAATKAFETALGKEPNYFPAVASLAAIDLEAGRPDAARKRFEEVVQNNPKSHQALLALAELQLRTGGSPDEVIKLLRAAVKANAGEPAPHLALVRELLSRDPKAALTAAREAAAALPGNTEIQDALGRTQLAANDPGQAVATYKALSVAQPTNPAWQVRLGEALLSNKDPEGSKGALRRALEIRPDFVSAQRALVGIAVMEKKYPDALALARDMQKRNPKEPLGFSLEGDVFASQRNWDAAVSAYRTTFSLAKSNDALVRLHTTLRAGGKKTEAEKMAADWLRERPKDAAFRYYLGDVSMTEGNFPAAETHYRSVLEVQPKNSLAMNNIAWLLMKQGKPGGLALAQQANDIMPGSPQLMDTLAMALAAEGKMPQALELQKSAVQRSGGNPSLKLSLAKLLIKSGDKAYARAELEDLAKLGDRFREQGEVAALLKTL